MDVEEAVAAVVGVEAAAVVAEEAAVEVEVGLEVAAVAVVGLEVVAVAEVSRRCFHQIYFIELVLNYLYVLASQAALDAVVAVVAEAEVATRLVHSATGRCRYKLLTHSIYTFTTSCIGTFHGSRPLLIIQMSKSLYFIFNQSYFFVQSTKLFLTVQE